MANDDLVSKESYNLLLRQVKELLEMQKKTQKQTDELIEIYKNALNFLDKNAGFYRSDRIDFVRNNSIFNNLSKDPALFIHIVPQDFKQDRIIDLSSFANFDYYKYMFPLNCPGCDHRFNSEGFTTFYKNDKKEIQAYDQIIRNGVFESYSSVSYELANDSYKFIYEENFLKNIYQKITDGITVLNTINIIPPFNIFISMVDITTVFIIRRIASGRIGPFNINKLYLPKFLFDFGDNEDRIKSKLAPQLDIIWQACGARGYNQ